MYGRALHRLGSLRKPLLVERRLQWLLEFSRRDLFALSAREWLILQVEAFEFSNLGSPPPTYPTGSSINPIAAALYGFPAKHLPDGQWPTQHRLRRAHRWLISF